MTKQLLNVTTYFIGITSLIIPQLRYICIRKAHLEIIQDVQRLFQYFHR
jgi:hypothetical protein